MAVVAPKRRTFDDEAHRAAEAAAARGAARSGIAIYELTAQSVSLEAAFMALTGDSVEYHGSISPTPGDADSNGSDSAGAPAETAAWSVA